MARTKKAKKEYLFDERDVGSWIDGAFGEGHAIEKMADMLRDVDPYPDLLAEYDDGEIEEEFENEWLDDATERLQENTAPGLVWLWDAGDLILTTEEEAGD